MRSQRKSSLGPLWVLTIILAATALFLPTLSLDSLLCYYCPLQQKGKSCSNITSQCLPDQRCSSSRGHYGPIHILSAQGCVDADLCGSHEIISHQGVEINVTHTCCCKDKCNSRPKSDTKLKLLLRMIKGKIDNTNITNVLREELWDSCANYTSSGSTESPTTAS
ncbi:protein Bouncer-like [Centropristis striata]|uniref:protein Bouncer-like n=1 Tax=Centropristis striata TaxID=184440 RepID=UPI0027E1B964|nr:protein Bouncer-like [Centropristis striata]